MAEIDKNVFDKLVLDVNSLKKDMESVKRHEDKFNKWFDTSELVIADLKLTSGIFREQIKDLPQRVRALEDKSIVTEIIKVAGWGVVGAFISAFIMQNFTATKEKQDYSIKKSK